VVEHNGERDHHTRSPSSTPEKGKERPPSEPDLGNTPIKNNNNNNNKKDRENKEKLKVAITSIVASLGLTIFKLAIGLVTNSLGILAEGLHSGLDVIAATMTFYAIRMIMRPPDFKYTYGYAKYESISSLAEVILLLAVASWIFYEGIERIFFKNIQPEITIFSFLILFISIMIDFGRSRVLYRTARKYGSQALEADALHFKTDMLSSSIVIVGLLLVLLGHVQNADAYAAMIVAGMIIYTSLGLGRRTLDVLLDKAPKGAYQRVVETVSGLEGVDKAHDIRVRKMGSETLVDLHIEVSRTSTHEKAHKAATTVEEKVKQAIPNSNVLVHVDAVKTGTETIIDNVRLIAADTDGIKNVHSIYLSTMPRSLSATGTTATTSTPTTPMKTTPYTAAKYSNKTEENRKAVTDTRAHEGLNLSSNNEERKKNEQPSASMLHLYLDVQMDEGLDLENAHNIIDSFEHRLKNEIPEISQITTHIETETAANSVTGTEKKPTTYEADRIRNLALSVDGVVGCEDIGIVEINGEQHITLTIKVRSTTGETVNTIDDAHRLATYTQNIIIKQTGASRVVVHTEPTR
jgi:cation diffusion facilitator family transporter